MSTTVSQKRKALSSLAKPTFADGPSAFLQQLTAKVQSNSVGNGGNTSEIQRVRSQLTSEVQNTHSKQEMRMRQLDSQLSLLQQKIRPQLQNIERQQGFTQNQLDSLRTRVQNLISEDISPLQQKFDQLGMVFDRFLRVDLESKLRPMQDDLRNSRAKLDELMSNVTTGFQRISDNVEELSKSVETTTANLSTQKAKFDKRLGEITPKLTDLEHQIKDLQSRLDETQGFGAGFQQLEKALKEALESVQYMQNEYIPNKIAESSASFVERMGTLTTRCDSELSNIQSELDGIIASNQQAEVERKDAEHNLELLITSSFEVENQLTTIETETKTKLDTLNHDLDSSVAQIRARLAEITHTAEDEDRQQAKLDESVEDLRHSIEAQLRDLREKIRVNSSKNMKAQYTTYSLLSGVRNTLEGDTNLIGHLENVEKQIDWCVEAIKIIDKERIAAQEQGADPQNIIARAKNVEERVTNALLRIKRIEENKKRAKPGKQKDDEEEEKEEKPQKKKKGAKAAPPQEEEEEKNEKPPKKKKAGKEKPQEEEEEKNEKPQKKKKAAKEEPQEEEEEKDEKPPKKKKAAKDKPKDDDEEPEKDDDEKEEPEEKPKKKKSNKPKEDEKNDDEKDDEEPEEPPKKRRKKKGKAADEDA